MTILVKKVFISSKPTFVYLLCPPLCGPFSIQESAAGGLSYKAKKTGHAAHVLPFTCLTTSPPSAKIPPSKSLRRTQDPPALPAWSASPVSSPHNPRSPTPAGFPQSSSSVPGPSQISHEPQFFLCILYSDRIHIRVRALRSGSFFQTASAPPP